MRSRSIVFVLFAVCALPATCSAGLITFGYSTSGLMVHEGYVPYGQSPVPGAGQAIGLELPSSSGNVYTFNTGSGQPISLPVVNYVPSLLALPGPLDLHPDGTTHLNTDEYFGVTVTLRDAASGETANVFLTGRAHSYNVYSTAAGWSGTTYFWFQDNTEVTLGGNQYTIWGTNHYDTGSASINVWVGSDPPVSFTPEPGTFILAAFGMTPFAMRWLRRRSQCESLSI